MNDVIKSEEKNETLVKTNTIPLEPVKKRKPRAKKTIKSDLNEKTSKRKKSLKQPKKSINKKDKVEKVSKRKKSTLKGEQTETPPKRMKSLQSDKQNEKSPNKQTTLTAENQIVQSSKSNQSTLQSNTVATTTPIKQSVGTMLEYCLTKDEKTPPPPVHDDYFTKKNQSMRQNIRRYNGFQLFAHINYLKAQEFAVQQENQQMVQSVLLSWWSNMPPVAKDKFIQIAEIQEMNVNKKKNQTENNLIETTNMQIL